MSQHTLKGFYKPLVRSAARILAGSGLGSRIFMSLSRGDLLPESIWRRLPVEKVFCVSLPNGTSFTYPSTAGDGCGRSLFWQGWKNFEPGTAEVFYNLARHSRGVLDIGANTGVYTLIACAANPLSKVIAFEPVPTIHAILVENIRINNWSKRCELRGEAVTDRVGSATLQVPSESLPTSATLSGGVFRGEVGHMLTVNTVTIDSLYADEKIDLVKIDVEGFEDRALEGMERLIIQQHPDIIVECLPDGPIHEVNRFLRSHGYHFLHLRENGPHPVDRILPDTKERLRNFLCTANPDIAQDIQTYAAGR